MNQHDDDYVRNLREMIVQSEMRMCTIAVELEGCRQRRAAVQEYVACDEQRARLAETNARTIDHLAAAMRQERQNQRRFREMIAEAEADTALRVAESFRAIVGSERPGRAAIN